MDSARVFSKNRHSYGQINNRDLEDQSPIPPLVPATNNADRLKLFVYYFIFSGTLFSLLRIHLLYLSAISTTGSSSSYLDSNSYDSIKLICKTTRYPDSCFDSISSAYTVPKPDPESILKLSLQLAVAKVSTLASFIKTGNVDSTLAMNDCELLLNDAVSQLNRSVRAMDVAAGEKMLTDKKISDMQTWVSAALADQETCMNGLNHQNMAASGAVIDDIRCKVELSQEYVSNALAILANIRFLL